MKALEAPEMVGAFHSASTLEIPGARVAERPNVSANSSSDPTVTLHPPTSPYTVMAGSVIPAVAHRRHQLRPAGSGASPGERECF